ncbi:MAG: FtsX-like permease family protein [bacterium]|nr:FtsX-like permease family protein [bacterium]
MFNNYLKIALRNLTKSKAFSAINILGLAFGMACCIFILQYIRLEMTYDSFHEDADRIFLVGVTRKSEADTRVSAGNFSPLAPALKESFPQVEYAGRIVSDSNNPVKYNDNMFYEAGVSKASPELFKIFNLPFIKGDPATALVRPGTVVLTETRANRYFGSEDPIGKSIKIGEEFFEVTGIMKDLPSNTSLEMDIVCSWESANVNEMLQEWHPLLLAVNTYVKLAEGVNSSEFESQISNFADNHIKDLLDEMGIECTMFLQPIQDIHLNPKWSPGTSTALLFVYVFSAIGIFILLIACMNFMNLSTARSINRSCEVGIRKIVGARRRQLITQFIGESLFISIVALSLALCIVVITLPLINELAELNLKLAGFLQKDVLTGMLILTLIAGIGAGCYPALFLSSSKPVDAVKSGKNPEGGRTFVRKTLVVGQFAISITLLISTITVYRQLDFMKSQPLGFEREQKMVLYLSSWELIEESWKMVKSELSTVPSVNGISMASGVPGRFINRLWIYPSRDGDNGMTPRILRCDYDFVSIFDLEMAAGRSFREDDRSDTFVINEAAVNRLGWSSPDEAVGKSIFIGSRRGQAEIIGVVKDFHWMGLWSPIESMIMRHSNMFRYITLDIDTENLSDVISNVEKRYNELFPGDIFEYFFLDTDFDTQYGIVERISRLIGIFTFIGLFIACLGLYGLASYVAEQKIKEIGIRKVLGSSVKEIITLLTKEFSKWVLIANVFAWPLAYFATDKLLQNFAFRVGIEYHIFLISGFFALIIAVLTVGFQSAKAALANPVDSLRYE